MADIIATAATIMVTMPIAVIVVMAIGTMVAGSRSELVLRSRQARQEPMTVTATIAVVIATAIRIRSGTDSPGSRKRPGLFHARNFSRALKQIKVDGWFGARRRSVLGVFQRASPRIEVESN